MSGANARRVAVAAAMSLVCAAALTWIALLEDSSDAPAPAPARHAATPRARRVRVAQPERADAAAPEPEPPPPAHAASLTVRVTSAERGGAVAGASVRVEDADCEAWSAATGDDGSALFAALPPGATEVRVEAKGALAAARTVVLAADERAEVAIALAPAAALEGVLVDQTTGAPVADAEIEFVVTDPATGDERGRGEARTDEKGRYRVEAVPPGAQVTLRLRGAGRSVRTVGVTADGGKDARVELPAALAGRVVGVVRDPDGHGLAHADVALRQPTAPAKAPPLRVADCGEDGAFAVEDVPFGVDVVAIARAPSWADSAPSAPIRLAPESASATRDLAVRRPAALRVAVSVEEGADEPPLVMVRLDDEPAATALSTGPGTAFREGLTPGPHRVRVAAENFLPEERRVDLAEGARETIEVRLTRGLAIAGTVVGADGAPIQAAVVVARDPNLPRDARALRADRGQTAIAGSGAFRVSGLLPCPYLVQAYVPNGPESAAIEITPPADGVKFVVARGTRISLRVAMAPGSVRPGSVAADASVARPEPNFAAEFDTELGPEPLAWAERSTVECEVAPGNEWLRLHAPGFAPVVVAMTLRPGRTADLGEVRLEPAQRVTGRVVDADGRGVAGARVGSACGDDVPVTSRDDGAFEVGDVGAGAVILRARDARRMASTLARSGATDVALVLRPAGTLRGRVVDADGFPVKDAVVAIRSGFADAALDPGAETVARTGDDGTFAAQVASGRVRATAGGGWTETEVPEDGAAEVTLTQR